MASIGTALSQPGPIVNVPAGTYTGAVGVFNPSTVPLTLVAQGADPDNDVYPCKIRCKTQSERMQLLPGSGPIDLIGFETDGFFEIGSNDFTDWRGKAHYEVPNLAAFLNDTTSWTSPDPAHYDEPSAYSLRDTNAQRGRFLGTDVFHVATANKVQSARGYYAAGMYVHDMYPSDTTGDPGGPSGQDRWHSDVHATSNGKNSDGGYDSCTFAPRRGGGSTGLGGAGLSDIIMCTLFAKLNNGDLDFFFNDCWLVGPSNYHWNVSSSSTGTATLRINTRTSPEFPTVALLNALRTYAWGSKQGDGRNISINNSGGIISISLGGAGLVDGPPSSVNIGVNDPATKWKQRHPFNSWQSYLGRGGAVAPDPPRNVRATPGDARITVLCDPPVSNGGSPITGYDGRVKNPAGTVIATLPMTAAARTATFTAANGIVNGTAYTPEARSKTSVDVSAYVAGAAKTPLAVAAPAWTSSTGELGVGKSSTPGKVGIIFDAPDVGAPFTSLSVATTPSTGAHPFPVDAGGGFITGLNPATSYTFAPTYTNSAGSATAPASDAVMPDGFAETTWKDSLGDTEGTLEAHPVVAANTATPPAPTTRASTQAEVLAAIAADIGSRCRYDLGIEAFRGNNAAFDAVLDRIEAAGLSFNIIVNHFTGNTHPPASAEASYRASFNALATRILSRYPGLRRKYEFVNEPTAHAGYSNPAAHMRCFRWFAEEARAADADCIISPGAPVHQYTSKPPATPGSNFYGMSYSGGAQTWCETDWIADNCDPAIVGANHLAAIIADVDGADHTKFRVNMHSYASERGTRSTADAPPGTKSRGTVVNGFREMPYVDQILTSRSIDCLIDVTEFGFPTAPSWVNKSYPKGTVLFPNEGTPNGANLWNRPQLYVAIAATNTRPGTSASWLPFNFSSWSAGSYATNRLVTRSLDAGATVNLFRALRTTTGTPGSSADWDNLGLAYNAAESPSILSTETQAAFMYENALREWFGVIGSIDGFPTSVAKRRYGDMDIFTLYDWPAWGFKYGARYADGTKKGLPISTGPWEKLKQLATNVDTRRQNIVEPPSQGTGCEPLFDVITINA